MTSSTDPIKSEFLARLQQDPERVTQHLLFDLRNALSPVISGATLLNDLVSVTTQHNGNETTEDVAAIVLEYAMRMQSILDALQDFNALTPEDVLAVQAQHSDESTTPPAKPAKPSSNGHTPPADMRKAAGHRRNQ